MSAESAVNYAESALAALLADEPPAVVAALLRASLRAAAVDGVYPSATVLDD